MSGEVVAEQRECNVPPIINQRKEKKMTDKIELKPCPFCGGEAEIIYVAMGTISMCRCCGAENGNGLYGAEGHKLAVKDWNTRPIEDELRKELRYYRNYSAALEKEVKTLRNALDQIRITLEAKKDGIVPTRFNLDSVDGYMMLSIVKKALKAK